MKFGIVPRVALLASFVSFTILWLSLPPTPRKYLQNPSFHQSNSRLLPFSYWSHRNLYPEAYTDDSCVEFPDLSDIHFASASWQLLEVENGSVYVYGAYWDSRFQESVVRVLVYSDVHPLPKLYCQLWYPNDNEPQLEVASPTYGWRPEWGGPISGVNEPYILSCAARRHSPERQLPPVAAAVVTTPCGVITNVVNVQNAPFENPLEFQKQEVTSRRNNSVAVCLKWLHYREDISTKLIEWLQLLKHLEAEKVFVYTVRVHPNIHKVLDLYESSGFIVTTDLSHPPLMSGKRFTPSVIDFTDMRRELLPINDCLYRNLGKFDWLAIFDLDEMIVPEKTDTWPELVQQELSAAALELNLPLDALVFPNFYVLGDAQKDLVGSARTPILSRTWRDKNPSKTGWFVKSFVNTSSVIAAHNHMPIACHIRCRPRYIDPEVGKLLHFREKCAENGDCPKEREVVRDDSIGRWRERVLKEIEEVEKTLNLGVYTRSDSHEHASRREKTEVGQIEAEVKNY